MSHQILLIVNPKAGRGKVQKKIPQIKQDLINSGYIVEIAYTKKKMGVKEIIDNCKVKPDIVICCGGDGTVNDLTNAIMLLDEKPKISFIPLGTVNDFAKTIGLSRIRFLLPDIFKKYSEIKADVGKFNNKYFNYVAAFGAFTPVSYVTSQKLKNCFGKFAYFIVAIKYLFKIRSYKVELIVDGEKIEKECIYASISNSKSIGGFQWFRKRDIAVNDGKFEVILVQKPKKKTDYINIIFNIFFKRYNSKNFFYKQGNNIHIKTDKGVNWTIDGEFGGRTKEANIENYSQEVTYVIPK